MASDQRFLFRSNEYLERFVRGDSEIRLLDKWRATDIILHKMPAHVTFYLDSSEDWPGFEFIYVLDGELKHIGDEQTSSLKQGDYIVRHLVEAESHFETQTAVQLLSFSSPPAFDAVREETQEFHELATQVEADEYIDGHSRRLEKMAVAVGEELELSGDQIFNLSYASFFHDIGKAKVPRDILQKPGKLTEAEWEVMKKHSEWGREFLEKKPFLEQVARIVEQIHERVDGNGYPQGLQGEQIEIEARIIAVVDAYDAMTTDRPYRRAMPRSEALRELKRSAEAQFDPDVVKAFQRVVDDVEAYLDRTTSARFNQELARLKQTESFLKISEKILAGRQVSEVLDDVIQSIVHHTPFQRGALALYDRPISPESVEEVAVDQVACFGVSPEEEAQLKASPLPPRERKRIFREAFKLGRSYFIPHDRHPWERDPGLVDEERGSSRHETEGWHPADYLFIPMWMNDEHLIGMISVDDPIDDKAPTQDTLEPIEMFASLAAIAIERARHVDKLNDFQTRLQGIYQLSARLSQHDDLDAVISEAVDIIRLHFHYDYVSFFRADEQGLILGAQEGAEALPYELGERLTCGEGIIGWALAHEVSVLVNDVSRDPRFVPGRVEMQSELAVPVQLRERALGVLNLESRQRGAFSQDDVRLLEALAGQLAVAISHLYQHQRLQEMAIHDPLTEVRNRRYLDGLFGDRPGPPLDGQDPISLVMIDFNSFYEVNDRYGHLEGDRVLFEAAQQFRSSVRAEDVVVRYGGDEFLIVLPATDADDAQRAGQRIQERIAQTDFGLDSCEISVRVGTATWHPNGERTLKDVLEEADQWIYRRRAHERRRKDEAA